MYAKDENDELLLQVSPVLDNSSTSHFSTGKGGGRTDPHGIRRGRKVSSWIGKRGTKCSGETNVSIDLR